MIIRTRFAPSPTGYLHIGGARTALFCWLYAHKMKGTFILRIEDTDLERSTRESVQAILDGMQWLGLKQDEGPFYQTERFDRYHAVIAQMLDSNLAYRCYCSKARLENLRAGQLERKEKPRYDGHCRHLQEPSDGPYVVRFKNPTEGEVVFDDLVRGKLTFSNAELDDLIIARSDGSPTYNFTVVVDDMDMNISHVIRGDDHINNTPRQINILRALGAIAPYYAHVPMILGPDGKRLSKRHGAVSVLQYREDGFLPEALLNYLVRLGWSHGDQEIFSMDEMTSLFDIKDINRSPAAFNLDKLLWLNQHYMKHSGPHHVARELAWHMQQLGIDTSKGPLLEDIVTLQAERTKTLREMAEKSRYFYGPVLLTEEMAGHFNSENANAIMDCYKKLSQLTHLTKEAVHEILMTVAAQYNMKLGKLAQPLRVALTGGTVSPPIDLTIVLLGKECVLTRLEQIFTLPIFNH